MFILPQLNFNPLWVSSFLQLLYLYSWLLFDLHLLQLPQLILGKMKITTLLVAAVFAVEYALASPAGTSGVKTRPAKFQCVCEAQFKTNAAKTINTCKALGNEGTYIKPWCFIFSRQGYIDFVRQCGGFNYSNCESTNSHEWFKEGN
ncbi:uncharacterized protein LY79DRAFT_243214 [Colletotrichum navitas]|uniref:Uncharacterized protein n=1 Tax=Colletotrichum navitas TaxID=681940 RepID=A0AAD8PWK1_9PEZI|nr:uncharacterized protein LY79DRAFT_243214 [Colletotrichum navitas]KAK1585979.1 hypothetical protein LY79DRAFT_243214 [Colletotrichum navitas]